jgi:hypothetical protein
VFAHRRQIFRDPPVPLTAARELAANRAAARSAREARRSFRTIRGQYRRYRAEAGPHYLDWPRWRSAYLREYRGGDQINEGGLASSSHPLTGGMGAP